jgi:8-oxo-dGTP pyrophosphatase MutT (NUDIX family)
MTDEIAAVALLQRRIACANRVWNVHFDHIRDGTGTEVRDFITMAPKQVRPDLVSGVAVLPVAGDNFGLLRSYRHAVERWVWELPRGFLDPAEEPATAAIRELREETGLICEPGNLLPLGPVMPECSTIRGRVMLFAARDCRNGGERAEDEAGLGQLHLLPRTRVLEMLAAFEIEEAMTLVALFRYLAAGLNPSSSAKRSE